MSKSQRRRVRPAFALVIAAACAAVLSLVVVRPLTAMPEITISRDDSRQAAETDLAATFPSWNADSKVLARLVSFVEAATDEGSDTYVEPADRIATFDMDGTIMCEKAPIYMDYCLLMYRVLDDPTYQADAETKELARKLRASADRGIVDDDLDDAKNEAFARVFTGMTPEEFRAYVNNFLDTVEAEGFEGMTYGQAFYKPMLEVIDYLKDNGFDVYMVSACEREVVRAMVNPRIGIDFSHVIGSDFGVRATGQTGEANNQYTFEQTDEIVFSGEILSDCGKFNKVVYIQREIGKRPILSFGNSSGDFSMLNYARSNPDHAGMGFLVVADDEVREYGNVEKGASFKEEAARQDWCAISMADDWATIYGEGVVRTHLVADSLADAA